MKIKQLKINSYGKLKNKELNFKNGINIVEGKNESGKSTIFHFIVNSFYGISKNKKGKEYSDFEKYKPWGEEEFSGKIVYELDNGESFEVFRDFKKKNPKIFNENKEDISKQFNIDKNKGNEFFYEQTKVDESLFLSTLVVNQQEVKLEKTEQNMLVQKIANLVGTGEDNVSYQRAIDRINRRQLNEIGTERSREKPINKLIDEIEKLENEKQELGRYEDLKYQMEENKIELNTQIEKLENENNYLKELKLLIENEKIENEKIKLQENIKNENLEKINQLKNEIEKIKNNNKNILENNLEKNKKIKNKINKKVINLFILLLIINILQFIFIKNNIFKYIFLLTLPTYIIFSIIFLKNKKNKIKKSGKNKKIEEEKINLEINNLNNQIILLEKNNSELEKEINKLKNNFNLKMNLEKEKIKNKYLNKIEKNKLEENMTLEKINLQIENIQNEINHEKIELHTLEIDKQNVEPKLDNLAKIEESLVNHKKEMSTLKNLERSMNLAKEVLNLAYEKMRTSVTPKFTQNLSETIAHITNGKYTNVVFHNEEGLIVELENGNYESVSKLSVGTIDQLYLSLRLSMIEELSEEKMPIILDEAFAYYDTQRLKNILNYLANKYRDRQIILFTCTQREKEILKAFNISYHLIDLQKI